MVELGGEAGRDPAHDRAVGIDVGGDAGRQRDLDDGDGDADVEVLDVDLERRGDVGRLGVDREALERLVDDAAAVLDLAGLAHQDDRHVDGDGCVGVDPEEVDVEHAALHRVPLQVLHDGEVALAVDVDGDEGVGAGLGRRGLGAARATAR